MGLGTPRTIVPATRFEIQKGSALLGGSWVVISGGISRVTIVITHIRGFISLLITAHEPPSMEIQRMCRPKGWVQIGRREFLGLGGRLPPPPSEP